MGLVYNPDLAEASLKEGNCGTPVALWEKKPSFASHWTLPFSLPVTHLVLIGQMARVEITTFPWNKPLHTLGHLDLYSSGSA